MKKILSLFLALNLIVMGAYMFFEPQIMDAATAYREWTVSQEVTGEIAIDAISDLSLSPAIPGLTGGVGVGTSTATTTTSNSTGYTLALTASTSPALQSGGNSFADYTPTGTTVPEYTWSVTSAAEFGYTVENANVTQLFKDSTSICNAGTNQTAYKCWYPASTTAVTIVNRSTSATDDETQLGFKAEINGTTRPSGTYSGKLSVTGTTNP